MQNILVLLGLAVFTALVAAQVRVLCLYSVWSGWGHSVCPVQSICASPFVALLCADVRKSSSKVFKEFYTPECWFFLHWTNKRKRLHAFQCGKFYWRVQGYPHQRWIGIRSELNERIAIHFNGNSFAQFRTNGNSCRRCGWAFNWTGKVLTRPDKQILAVTVKQSMTILCLHSLIQNDLFTPARNWNLSRIEQTNCHWKAIPPLWDECKFLAGVNWPLGQWMSCFWNLIHIRCSTQI